jgi:hypothetical protein
MRLSSSAAVASQRAKAEFVVPRSMPTMYLAATEGLPSKQTIVAWMEDQPLREFDFSRGNDHPAGGLR